MMWKTLTAAVFAALMLGCTDASKAPAPPGSEKKAEAEPEPKAETKHSGWWCAEHGVPEADCSLCSTKVAKACKDTGDWCDQHARAKSQCFKCDPKLKDKFAAQYRAKYGKEPPPTEDD